MEEKVKSYLEKKTEEIEAAEKKKREKLLNSIGLYEKVYSPNGDFHSEYTLSEWSEAENKRKYYKKVFPQLTDEEYSEIEQITNKSKEINAVLTETSNTIANVLSVVAVIVFIIGFILGIAMGSVEVTKGTYYTYTDTEFSFSIALAYWFVSFVSGILLLGFAEIINLLDAIKNK